MTQDRDNRIMIEQYCDRIEYLEKENAKLKKRIQQLEKPNHKSTGGRIPFGYKCEDGVNLTKDFAQQQIIIQMRTWRKKGDSYRKIADNVESQYKVKLSHSGVRRILNRNPEPQTKFIF